MKVTHLKRVQERETTEVNGIWQPRQGSKVQKGAHLTTQLRKGSFSDALKERVQNEIAKRMKRE